MNKLLIIGFQPLNEEMYPHTFELINALKKAFDLDYVYFDRGYNTAIINENKMNRILSFFSHEHTKHLYEKIENEQNITINFDQYKVILAIDHWALRIAAKNMSSRSKLIFWSLDFISPESKWAKTLFFNNLIMKNKDDICKAEFIIIQDRNRARVLDEILMSNNIKKIFLPVSLFDDKYARDITKFKNNFESIKKPSVMQIHATRARGSNFLLKEFQSIKNVDLIFQGTIDESIKNDINNYTIKPKIFPYVDNRADLRTNISRADIGLINYEEEDRNHKYISHASGQLVEYLRFGIPVIIWKPEDLGRLVSSNNAGAYITDLRDLQKAILMILNDYSNFSKNARLLYESQFNLSIYIEELISCISSLLIVNI